MTPDEVPAALADDTLVFVVRSRWGTTIHRGYTAERRHRRKGDTPPWIETYTVDHPVCQVGSRALSQGARAYHAAFTGPFHRCPMIYLAQPGIKGLSFCRKCWS